MQGGKAKLPLRFDPDKADNGEAPGRVDCVVEQGCLADPGFASQD